MISSELAKLLSALSGAYVEGQILKRPPSYSRIVADLEKFGDLAVEQAITKLLAGLKPDGAKKKRQSATKPTNDELVAMYVRNLEQADGDESQFDKWVDEIRRDRDIRAGKELPLVLKLYSGGALSGANKADRIEKLKHAYTLRQTQLRNRDLAQKARPF